MEVTWRTTDELEDKANMLLCTLKTVLSRLNLGVPNDPSFLGKLYQVVEIATKAPPVESFMWGRDIHEELLRP